MFVPLATEPNAGDRLVYYPRLISAGEISYRNQRLQVHEDRTFIMTVEPDDDTGTVDWENAAEPALELSDLDSRPDPDAEFTELPASLANPKNYTKWEKELNRWIRKRQPLVLYRSPSLKKTSKPGETEREFRIRLQQIGNERRDLKVAKLRERYERKVAVQEERLRRAEQAVERQSEQATAQKLDTALSFGTAILGALLGRKRVSATSASRASTAMRKASRIGKESADVRRAHETVAAVKARIAELETAFEEDVAELDTAYDAQTEELVEQRITPKTTDIQIKLIGLGWFPYVEGEDGQLRAAWNQAEPSNPNRG